VRRAVVGVGASLLPQECTPAGVRSRRGLKGGLEGAQGRGGHGPSVYQGGLDRVQVKGVARCQGGRDEGRCKV